MNFKNILITSISSKVPLVKAVIQAKNKFNKQIKIYGADIKDEVIARYFVDYFWKMPKIKELSLDFLIDFCKKNNIGYIIPTRDEDVVFLSKNKEKLLKNNIFSFVSNYHSVLICYDKLKFYKYNQNRMVIPTFTDINSINSLSFVVKERYGSGSENIAINISKNEAIDFAKGLTNPIFQPYICGKEYSVDSYVDKYGKCISAIVRSRDLVINGESKITTSVKDETLQSKVIDFLESNNILGHSVLQVIKLENSYYILECNARFGGASTLSLKLGLESFYWFLLECNNQPIQARIIDKTLKQIRIFEDIYLES